MRSAARWALITLAIIVAVVGWLPGSFFIAYASTQALTGWEKPEGIIQGCESNLHCAEGGIFFPVLGGAALLWPLVAFLLLRRLSDA